MTMGDAILTAFGDFQKWCREHADKLEGKTEGEKADAYWDEVATRIIED